MSRGRPPGPRALDVGKLHRPCDAAELGFETTADLPLEELGATQVLGQGRAVEALRFGVGMRHEGYHLFAMGPVGAGKRTIVETLLRPVAAAAPVPSDVCYVENFEAPHRPKVLLVPAGRGGQLKEDIEGFIDSLKVALPAALESDEFRTRKEAFEEELKDAGEKAFAGLRERARDKGVAFLRTPAGFAFAPLKGDEVLSPKDFGELPEPEQERLKRDVEALGKELQEVANETNRLEREAKAKLKALLRETFTAAIGAHLRELRQRYAALSIVLEHLSEMERAIVDDVSPFLRDGEGGGDASGIEAVLGRGREPLGRFKVHVLVDRSKDSGAPVVYEDHPTLPNLLGRVEHRSQLGTLLTDFHLIKPGALHRANGGYLLLPIRALLTSPNAWEALKRSLLGKSVRIESLAESLSLVSTVGLEPEPVPLDLKVVLLGERRLLYLLQEVDPDFDKLFKVLVDFEDVIDRTREDERVFSRIVAGVTKDSGLRPLACPAVARVIDECSRQAGDAKKLSTHMGLLKDLLCESDEHARLEESAVIQAFHVERAIEQRRRRSSRVEERLREQIVRGGVLIDTVGKAVGQVNALSVLSLGSSTFGRPSRITARVRLGAGAVVDIEREVALGGPIHSKGVLILHGFLAARYATDYALSLAATLVFEQSYGGVDGDSASCAELAALLSAIAEVPLRQDLAVTGSINQHGGVQAVGGVNEKIEGFFELCAQRGLSGSQGVLIPEANVDNLMLRRPVVEAVEQGHFSIFVVRHVDEALALLTGKPAGVRGRGGRFPKGSVNRLVEDRLVAMARRRSRLGGAGKART